MSKEVFKVGDTVFISNGYSEGWFPVEASEEFEEYPLEVNNETYTEGGKILIASKYSSLHRTDFTGKGPSEREIDWSKVSVGTEIIDWHGGVRWYLAYYMDFHWLKENEYMRVFSQGKSQPPTFPKDFTIPDAWYKT